jgi:lactate dehydrogenase-like 2-hydroxyacid dehydrogenase
MADMETVFATSDVVSLHCPLTAESRGLVSAARLARMKSTAFLIGFYGGAFGERRDRMSAASLGALSSGGKGQWTRNSTCSR